MIGRHFNNMFQGSSQCSNTQGKWQMRICPQKCSCSFGMFQWTKHYLVKIDPPQEARNRKCCCCNNNSNQAQAIYMTQSDKHTNDYLCKHDDSKKSKSLCQMTCIICWHFLVIMTKSIGINQLSNHRQQPNYITQWWWNEK